MLTPENSAALLAPLVGAKALLLAVSGGPDSMALLHIAARWRDALPAPPAVFAATVDHGLRRDSAAEADLVAAVARRLGVPHETLVWRGDKPQAAVQEQAREARYDLLCAHATRIDADVIVTAHHADDQAETLLMRLARGGSIAGLAGMRPTSERGGVILARPLLPVEKARLIAHCEVCAIPFVRDPSNEDPRFERARVRALAPKVARAGLDAKTLGRLAKRAARAEDALAAFAIQASGLFAAGRSQGTFRAPMADLAALPEEIAIRLVCAEAVRVGGGAPPRLERAERACARLLESYQAGVAVTLTLAGARISLDGRGFLEMMQEKPRRRGVRGAGRPSSIHSSGSNCAPDGSGSGALPLATGVVAPRLSGGSPPSEVRESDPLQSPAGLLTGSK